MKKILTIFFVLMMMIVPVSARDVECDHTTVDAIIQKDGTTVIKETWEIDFEGDYSQFERNIPINENERITDVSVFIDGHECLLLNQPDDRRPNHCYAMEMDSDEMILYIYMQAYNETKTFTIQYTIDGAVHGYKDVAEFNYNMIGDGWDLDMNGVSGTITFPSVADSQDIYVWGHGPANGNVSIVSNESVYYECDYLEANTAINIRLLLPTELFSIDKINHAYLNEIIEEETQLAKEEANRQKWQRMVFFVSGGSGLIVGLGGFAYVFIQRRRLLKAIQPAMQPDYYRDIPSDLSPSEVIDLMNYVGHDFAEKNKFSSTLMSLSLKGLLDFEEYEKEGLFKTKKMTKMRILPQNEVQLKTHEQILYDFIVLAGDGSETTFDDIENLTNRRPKYCKNKLDDFRSSSTLLLERDGYFDLRVKTGPMMIASIAMLIIGGISVFFAPFFAIPVLVLGVVSVILAGTCKRYSQKGADEVALWEAFERFLKEFTLMDEKELPELIMWEEYLVYAVAMGIGEQVLKQLPEVYPNFYESDIYTRSYVRHFYYGRYPRLDMFDDFNGFSNRMETAMNYTENTGGRGGSFSGGGGGFAGGGHSSGGGGGSFS